MKKTITVLSITVVIVIACTKKDDDFTPDCATTKSFATDVSPIIQTFCNTGSNCHTSGSTNGPGQLTNYTEVFNARTSIRAAVASGIMPENTTLTAAQKNNIICWIDSGAPNN